jgi:hypothetical protein
MLLNCDVEGARRPSETADTTQLDLLTGGEANVHPGRGINHFSDCVDRDLFRREEH